MTDDPLTAKPRGARKRNYRAPDPSLQPSGVTANGLKCGAKKRHGGTCAMPAGWGTEHPGIGKCKVHGGAAPSHVKAAAKKEYRTLLGTPMEINAVDAIIMCIKIRAGEVEWLGEELKKLQESAWVEETMVGKQFHLYARERQAAMRDLAKFSQMAIAMGLAERAVKLAEQYGETLARLMKAIGDRIWPYLNEEGRKVFPLIVRQELLAIDGGKREATAQQQVAGLLPAAGVA